MIFWIFTITAYPGERVNEIVTVLFDETLIKPKLMELFSEDQDIYTIKVETWFKEPNNDDASFCDWETYCRCDMDNMR